MAANVSLQWLSLRFVAGWWHHPAEKDGAPNVYFHPYMNEAGYKQTRSQKKVCNHELLQGNTEELKVILFLLLKQIKIVSLKIILSTKQKSILF